MNTSIFRLAASTVAVIAVALVLPAVSAAETAVSQTSITPRGTLFKEAFRPVDTHLKATVIPDPGSPKLRELINTRLNLPTDLRFDTTGTPVCHKDLGQIDPNNANRPTAAVIAECPGSVVGQGTAVINVAGFVSARVTDSKLTIFNGGKDKNGNPILLTHGYSATVIPGGFGIIMVGSLNHGVLDVKVPPLAANSAVTEFTLDLPGEIGRDPDFAESKCTTGKWTANAVLTLGTYDANTGQYVNKSDVATPLNHQSCDSQDGKAAFVVPVAKGPKTVKAGSSHVYAVTLANRGTASARGVKLVASGKGASGKASAGNIAPGSSRKVKVRVKFSKSGAFRLKFKASGAKVKARSSTLAVRVKR